MNDGGIEIGTILHSNSTVMPNSSNISVAVIGAGFAGLRAADTLSRKQHIKVTLFEARDRVGGRVAQDTSLGFPLDLGANWIHDTEETADGEPNRITPIAEATGAVFHDFSEGYMVYDEHGKELDATIAEKAYNYLHKFHERGTDRSEENLEEDYSTPINASESLGGFIREAMRKDVAQHPHDLKRNELSRLVLHLMEEGGSEVGEPSGTRSLRYSSIEECDEDDEFIASTYQDILRAVSQPVLEYEKVIVHFNSPVTRIEPTKDRSNNHVRVEITYITHFETQPLTESFDYVIIAIPIAVLRRNHAQLLPTLPQSIATSLSRLYAGRLEKVYIQFSTAFWDTHLLPSKRCSFFSFLAPNYAPDTNPNGWFIEAMSLSGLPEDYAHPVLLFFLFGDCASHVVSLSHGKTKAEAHTALDQFFKPYYSRLPRYTPGGKCDAKAFVATTWSADPYAGGSYVTFLAGEDEGGPQDVKVMGQGWPEMNVYFAGEGTTVDGLGTTNGAYVTGEKAALRIIEDIRSSN